MLAFLLLLKDMALGPRWLSNSYLLNMASVSLKEECWPGELPPADLAAALPLFPPALITFSFYFELVAPISVILADL